MAEVDDESFGDFTFASFPNSLNTQFTPPKSIINNPKNTLIEEDDDDEWGDFVEYPLGSEPESVTQSKKIDPFEVFPNGVSNFESPAKSEQQTKKPASQWVKPSGALPLSLFGEEANDEEVKKEEIQKPVEITYSTANGNGKVMNGSVANWGLAFNSVIANLYNDDQKLKSETGSLSNSNGLVGLDAVDSNGKESVSELGELGFNSNSGSPTVSRVQSLSNLINPIDNSSTWSGSNSSSVRPSFSGWNMDLNPPNSNLNGLNRTVSIDALTRLNNQGLQIKTEYSNGLSSYADASGSNFTMWNPESIVSKSTQNGLNRTSSLNFLTSLNDKDQQIKTESTGLVFNSHGLSSSARSTSSSFGVWDSDFIVSKSNQNELNRTSSLDALTSLNDKDQQIKTESTGLVFNSHGLSSSARSTSSNFGVWDSDFIVSKSNQNELNRTSSLDALTNLKVQQPKTESTGLVLNSNGSSSFVNPSTSNSIEWSFDFGGLGSDIKKSNSVVSSNLSELQLNINAAGASETLNGGLDEDNVDDDDDGWEFKDAYTDSTVGDGNNKAKAEAEEEIESKAFSFEFHNGLNGSVNLFATSNGSATGDAKKHNAGSTQAYSSGFGNSHNGSIDIFATANKPAVHPDNIFGFDIQPPMTPKNSSNSARGEQKSIAGELDPHSLVESDESDEDFGDFTTAFADSGLEPEQEWKVNDFSRSELQASKSDDKDQVKVSKLENKGALPLSIFGDEELEIDGSSNAEDTFVRHPASYMKNDRSPDSNISINDLISNLYSQAEHISPVQTPNSISDSPQDSVSNTNLVNCEDDFDDGDWEFKDGSSQMGMDNDTSLLTCGDPQRDLSNLKLDDYLDFYHKLRNELCYHAKGRLEDLKRDQSVAGLSVEEDDFPILNEEIEEACKELDLDNVMCKGDHLEGHLSLSACLNAFIEILQEPKFQVLESEYHLSRRLSLVENDLTVTVDLIRHSTMMLKILRSGSLEEQLIYVSVWYKMISVCAQELQHGSCMWKKILEMNAQSHLLSHPRGKIFILALGEIYRVSLVLEASVKLCKPWTWSNSVQCTSIHSLLDECHSTWSSLGLGEALVSMSDSPCAIDESSVASLLSSIKFIHGLDALTLQKHLFSQKDVCRLSLLPLEVLPGMKHLNWNGEHYFLTLANMWANLINSDPPELPHLNFGR